MVKMALRVMVMIVMMIVLVWPGVMVMASHLQGPQLRDTGTTTTGKNCTVSQFLEEVDDNNDS